MTAVRFSFSLLFISLAYVISITMLPWWVTVCIAVLILSLWKAYAVVIAGSVFMDLFFAGGVTDGFPFVYISVFALLSFITWFLDRTMLE